MNRSFNISLSYSAFILFNLFALIFCHFAYAQEEENDSSGYIARKWFYSQRSAPFDTIPATAFTDAITQRNSLNPGGPYLSTTWSNIGPVSLDGKYSGRVTAIRFTNDNRLIIG